MQQLQFIGERTLLVDYNPVGEHRDFIDITNAQATITDEHGIPLHSDRKDPPKELDFEYQACPYSDSPTRYPGGLPSPVPMSGLEQRRLVQSYPRIRRQLLATRAAYFSIYGLSQDHELNSEDGTNILCMIQGLPTYLTERAKNPVAHHGSLPQHIVVSSNSASGAIGALGAYSNSQTERWPKLADGAVMLDAAEKEPDGGLVGQKTVCAASPVMIRQFLNLLKNGSNGVQFGTIENETDDLLKTREIPAVLSLGLNMESVLFYNDSLGKADYELYEAIKNFNPKKHNPRRLRTNIEIFNTVLGNFVEGYNGISASVNSALGRVATRPGEFDGIVSDNIFDLASIKMAKQKKIPLHF